jgi:hypothetical protein
LIGYVDSDVVAVPVYSLEFGTSFWVPLNPYQRNIVLGNELMQSRNEMIGHILLRNFAPVLTKLSN